MLRIFYKFFGVERRRFERTNTSVIVLYKVNLPSRASLPTDKEVNAIMLNLSEDGMSILSNYDIPVSTIVTTRCILTNDKAVADRDRLRAFELKGKVCYSYFSREKAYRIGIHFLELSDIDRRFISDFIHASARRR